MAQERYISFLDMLGFSKVVMDSDLDELIRRINGALINVPFAETLGEFVHENGKLVPNRQKRKCICFSFSDTFVLSSPDTSPDSLNNILIATYLLTRGLFAYGFPVRGAIAKGEADYIPNTQHLVGKAVITAAQLEKQQDWFGIALSPEVLPDEESIRLLKQSTLPILVHYPVPVKGGSTVRLYVINWRLNMTVVKGTKSMFPPPYNEETQRKFDNTLAFAKYLRDTGQAYMRLPEPWQQGLYVSDTDPTLVPPAHGDEY